MSRTVGRDARVPLVPISIEKPTVDSPPLLMATRCTLHQESRAEGEGVGVPVTVYCVAGCAAVGVPVMRPANHLQSLVPPLGDRRLADHLHQTPIQLAGKARISIRRPLLQCLKEVVHKGCRAHSG